MSDKRMNDFYNSSVWRKTKENVWKKQNCICAICGRPIYLCNVSDRNIPKENRIVGIVHHIKPINESNVNDYNLSLNEENLIGLCITDHDLIHRGRSATKEGYTFDDKGQFVKIGNYDLLNKLIIKCREI